MSLDLRKLAIVGLVAAAATRPSIAASRSRRTAQ